MDSLLVSPGVPNRGARDGGWACGLCSARERCGLTVEHAAELIGKAPEVLDKWESGEVSPTYVQLETLAYKVYKRPVAVFFFPEPPDEPEPAQEFRTLPDFEIDDLVPETRLKIRQARSLQLSISELASAESAASERLITRDLTIDPTRSAEIAARKVRSYLGVELRDHVENALKAWRTAVENCGVFVFKDTFNQREVSGFSLFDPKFPLIMINNSTSKSRQIFTLFHELGHLLAQTGGVTLRDDTFIRALGRFG